MDAEGISKLVMFFHSAPPVEFDIEKMVKQACNFDVAKLSFDEFGSMCVVTNSVFTQEIYQQMVATMKEVTDSIFNFVSASLSNVFEDFRARVGKERATATDLVNKTKQIIEQKLRMTDVKEAFDAIEDLDSEFRKKLHTVKTMLSERSNAPLHPPSRTKSNPHQKAQPLGNDGPDAEGRNSGRGGRGRGGRAGHTSPSPEKIAPLHEMFEIHHTNLIFFTFLFPSFY